MTSKVSIVDVLRSGYEATRKNFASVGALFVGLQAVIFILAYVLKAPFFNILMLPIFVLMEIAIFRSFKSPIEKFDINKILGTNEANFKPRLWLILYLLGWGIILGLLFVLLVIPGIFFGVYWYLSSYVFLDQGTSFMDSLRKSKDMIKGHWWKTFGLILIMVIINAIASSVVSSVTGTNSFMSGLLMALVSGLSSVYFGYVAVAYYFSLKR